MVWCWVSCIVCFIVYFSVDLVVCRFVLFVLNCFAVCGFDFGFGFVDFSVAVQYLFVTGRISDYLLFGRFAGLVDFGIWLFYLVSLSLVCLQMCFGWFLGNLGLLTWLVWVLWFWVLFNIDDVGSDGIVFWVLILGGFVLVLVLS